MRVLVLFLLFSKCLFCLAGEDTNVVALSDWSEPVENDWGKVLRVRILVEREPGGVHQTKIYLEIQNVSDSVGRDPRLYYSGDELHLALRDANGEPAPRISFAGSVAGGGYAGDWIAVPSDSTVRLRYNPLVTPSDGIVIGNMEIRPGNTNIYSLSGSLVFAAPTNALTRQQIGWDSDQLHPPWEGTLVIPKTRVLAPK